MKKLIIQNLPDLPFEVEEAINQLRVNLGFCGEEIRTIMVASSVPNEGKSFITLHLWKMLSELGSRTLLIDCDLRKSELRTQYEISCSEKIKGITYYLSGKIELEDAIYETNIDQGFLMPLSAPIVNPTILLESQRFAAMMESCAKRFDYILIDTPPLESVADAMKIATYADGVVMVVRSGKTSRKLVENATDKLKRAEVPVLGYVLNRAGADQKGNYYYKRYYQDYYKKDYAHYGYSSKTL